MRIPVLYQITSILLSIVAFLFSIGSLLNIINVGAQPMVLIMFFMTLAIVIYLTLCFKLNRVVNEHLSLQRRTKDWIKVNGFVGLVFCVLMLIGAINFLSNPEIIDRIFEMVSAKMEGLTDINFLKNVFHTIVVGMLVYVIILIIHIIASLIFIRRYSRLQQNEATTSF